MGRYPDFVQEITQWLTSLPDVQVQEAGQTSCSYSIVVYREGHKPFVLHLKVLRPISVLIDNSVSEIIQLAQKKIVLWEDQWITKKKVLQSRLRSILGLNERIPARMTQARRVARPDAMQFLTANHQQVALPAKYSYGLYLPQRYFRKLTNPPQAKELLVAVATFARPRVWDREGKSYYSYELVRFASLNDTTVVGGLDKLLRHFIRAHQPDDIMTYIDLESSDGHSFLHLGFESHGDTPPLTFWVDQQNMTRYSPNRLPEGNTPASAATYGLIPIQNAGSRKLVKTIHS